MLLYPPVNFSLPPQKIKTKMLLASRRKKINTYKTMQYIPYLKKDGMKIHRIIKLSCGDLMKFGCGLPLKILPC